MQNVIIKSNNEIYVCYYCLALWIFTNHTQGYGLGFINSFFVTAPNLFNKCYLMCAVFMSWISHLVRVLNLSMNKMFNFCAKLMISIKDKYLYECKNWFHGIDRKNRFHFKVVHITVIVCDRYLDIMPYCLLYLCAVLYLVLKLPFPFIFLQTVFYLIWYTFRFAIFDTLYHRPTSTFLSVMIMVM